MNSPSLNHAYSSGVFTRWTPVALFLVCFALAENVCAEELSTAVAAGKVSVSLSGNGGSSGDSVLATVKLADKAGDPVELTIAPGTRLKSGSSRAQNMVVAGVKGEMLGGQSYRRTSTMSAGATATTYVLDAYCAEFEKDNPGAATHFSVGSVDPVLACILKGTSGLSVQAKQAAVWIYTDHATFGHVNQKFSVTRSDWDAAAAVVKSCSSTPKGSEQTVVTPPPPAAEEEVSTRSDKPVSRLKFDADGNLIVAGKAVPEPSLNVTPPAKASTGNRSVRVRIDANGDPIMDGAAQAPAERNATPAKAPTGRRPVVKLSYDSPSISEDSSGTVSPPATTSAAPADAKVSSDETAWNQTDKVSDVSLEKYISQFREGAHFKDAKVFLALSKQLQAIAAGTTKADVVIPFEALGKQWQVAETGQGVAFAYSRTEKEGAMTGAFWRTPSLDYRGVRSGARGSFADQRFSSWPESAPTGNGSIVAFDTQGEECPLRAAPVIVSNKDNIVYFGVVEKIGFVHLSGKGRVIFADGSTKNLE
ncbi:MAG: hypothetical protein JWR15_1841 [Prosthecobacter sp.]|nr:hypothetical protein [Prosthecobacter sp.]